jgi:diguanylate cyclase (GGDEF)-like protein
MYALGSTRVGRALGLHQTAEDVYPQLDWPRSVRVGGALWLFGSAVAAAILPLQNPTHLIGEAGWPVAIALVLGGLSAGACLLAWPRRVSPNQLLAMGYLSVAAIALGDLLVGGNMVFTLLLLLVAPYPSALHPPSRVLPLVSVMVLLCIGLGALQHPRGRHLVEGFVAALVLAFLAVMTLLYARTTRALATALDRQRDKAESLARTDELTGLGNRRAFTESLAGHIALTNRYSRPLSMVMLDVDGFKSINDNFGHDVGDAALAAVARILLAEIRDPDLCFRWGGDEFAVLLPETTTIGAEAVAARLSAAAARDRTLAGGHRLSITGGVAECRPTDLPDDLMARADAGLLENKRVLNAPLRVDLGSGIGHRASGL